MGRSGGKEEHIGAGIKMDRVMYRPYFYPTPSFIAFLIFAREMIEAPNHFHYYNGGRSKPYLK